MVAGDEREGRADEVRFEELEGWLVEAVVECEEREDAGVGGGNAHAVARLEGLEGGAEQARGEAAGPLVEVADEEAWWGEVFVAEDLFAEQEAGLPAALVEAGAEVNVEEVQCVLAEVDVGLEGAALFATAGEVVIVPGADGKA